MSDLLRDRMVNPEIQERHGSWLLRVFQTFKERNVFEDQGLSELVDRAKAVLNGTSAGAIRESSYLKDHISAGMQDVYKKVEEMLNVPRRKIVMD